MKIKWGEFDWEEESPQEFVFCSFDSKIDDIYLSDGKISSKMILFDKYKYSDDGTLRELSDYEIENMISNDYYILIHSRNPTYGHGWKRLRYSELVYKYPRFKI